MGIIAPGIYGSRKPANMIASAERRLFDMVSFGDSNEFRAAEGHNDGQNHALDQRYAAYGVGLGSVRDNLGNAIGRGYLSAANVSDAFAGDYAVTGAPAEFEDFMDFAAGAMNYGWLSDVATSSTNGPGVSINSQAFIDYTHHLRYELDYGQRDTTGTPGTFNMFCRRGESPWTQVAFDSGGITPADAAPTKMITAMLDIPADTGRSVSNDLAFQARKVGGAAVDGEMFFTYQTVTDLGIAAGYRFTSAYGNGGASLRDCALDMQNASDNTLTHLFSRIRDRQVEVGLAPYVVMIVNFGVNDRNETLVSVGPAAVSDGDSAEAYLDNATAFINRIEAIWTLNGWSLNELGFIFIPSHSVSLPTDDAELVSYRTAMKSFNQARSLLDACDEFQTAAQYGSGASSWWNSNGTNPDHLSDTVQVNPSGYQEWGIDVLDQVLLTAGGGRSWVQQAGMGGGMGIN